MTQRFRAVMAKGQHEVAFVDLGLEDLEPHEVLVEVAYSSLNYKDGLAITGKGRIARKFPMVLGIDLAGTVVASDSPLFKPGDQVLGIGQTLSESEWGGYSRFQRVRADVLIPIPPRWGPREAMAIGTAGFTAMLCVMGLEHMDVQPDSGPIVVTGAGGGVGSFAISLLAGLGYEVVAATGRPQLGDFLKRLGARDVIDRNELTGKGAPLQGQRWAGAVDAVGGDILANIIAQTRYGGAVTACGMAHSPDLAMSVFPFILRNVSLLGCSSSSTPRPRRLIGWERLARDLRDEAIDLIAPRNEPLGNIFELANQITRGQVEGRLVIDVAR